VKTLFQGLAARELALLRQLQQRGGRLLRVDAASAYLNFGWKKK
jgi:hypothetical protein